MCGVCTTKGLYKMNSRSEYPDEDKSIINYAVMLIPFRIEKLIYDFMIEHFQYHEILHFQYHYIM